MDSRLKSTAFIGCSKLTQWFVRTYTKHTLGVDVTVDIAMTVVGVTGLELTSLDLDDRLDFATISLEMVLGAEPPSEQKIQDVAAQWAICESEMPLFCEILRNFAEESYI